MSKAWRILDAEALVDVILGLGYPAVSIAPKAESRADVVSWLSGFNYSGAVEMIAFEVKVSEEDDGEGKEAEESAAPRGERVLASRPSDTVDFSDGAKEQMKKFGENVATVIFVSVS